MTNSWNDIKNADLVLIMGGNPAENHPCGFKWALKAREQKGAKIVCIDPRFTRTAAVSDVYLPLRPGSDIAFMGGVINYVLQNKKYQAEYVKAFTNAPMIVKETYKFDEAAGLFSGYNAEKRAYDQSLWDYEKDEKGMAKMDLTLSHPRCAFNLLKAHYARYTPELVEMVTGVKKEDFLKVAALIGETGVPDKSMVHLYALGWTHHSFSVQLIGTMALLQLLLGNIGVPGGGIGALRGHSNVQGTTDLGCFSPSLPGYLKSPKADWKTLKEYLEANTPKPLREHSMNFYSNTPKFMVSLLKAWWGGAATKENDFAYHYLPKYEKPLAWDAIIDDMYHGKMEGLFLHGTNFHANSPHAHKVFKGLSKLKWLVINDCFPIDTAEFWKFSKEVKAESIQTEVLLLPALNFAEKDGVFANSGRVLKWRWKGPEGPGDARDEKWVYGDLFSRLKTLFAKEKTKFPEPILHLAWAYKNPLFPTAEEVLAEMNGYALADLEDAEKRPLAKKGDRLATFAHLRDDGTTSCGVWIYGGVYPQSGNRAAATGTEDPSGLGVYPNYGFAWPANRRILYNRASADPSGKPWGPNKRYLWWSDADKRWTGVDIPDIGPALTPETGPFIMLPEAVGRLYAPQLLDGPFPEFYEPYESPMANVFHPQTNNNPVVKIYKSDIDVLGAPDKFPYVCATYRVTEHFHWYTKYMYGPSRAMPNMFIELPVDLAKEKGIANGEYVKVTSARGSVTAMAMVTERIPKLTCNGKTVYTVGVPIHWGYSGLVTGDLANVLTPFIWDPNAGTPEYKGFLCTVEKAKGGVA